MTLGRGSSLLCFAVLLLGACSGSSASGGASTDSGSTGPGLDASANDSSRPDAGSGDATTRDGAGADAGQHDATSDGSGDASTGDDAGDDATSGDDASDDASFDDASFDGDFGDVIVIGPPPVDASLLDAATDGPKLDACGICDQVWTCNGFAQSWVSSGSQACTNTVNHTTLYCEHGDTINYADATNNDGTWATTSSGFAMYFNNLGGGTVEIDCVPGS